MTYYLYVPIAQEKVSSTLQATIKDWVKAENIKQKEVVVTYLGEKGLKNLPPYAKIYVLAPGTATTPTSIEKQAKDYELALNFPSTSQQFYLSEGKTQLSVPKMVDEMIADGLFSRNAEELSEDIPNIHIKLFFQNAGKQASRLAKIFEYFIDLKKPTTPVNIRMDYYPDSLLQAPGKKGNPHKYAIRSSKNTFLRAKEVRESLFSEGCQPMLSIEAVREAVREYYIYKSSRFCGLSHVFGLNEWFTSKDSALTIDSLLKPEMKDEERFIKAKNFVKAFPNNKLADYLRELVDNSVNDNKEKFWSSQAVQV